MTGKKALLLALILLLAGAWRLLEARARWHEPLGFGDERQYLALGLGMREGGLLGEAARPWQPTARRAPMYPALLSFVARPRGNAGLARALNAFLASLTVLAVYALVAQAHSAAAGLVAAGLVGANGALAAWSGTLFIETLFGLLVACCALAVADWSIEPDERRARRLGLAAGVSLLCRSNLFAVPAAVAAWHARRGGPDPGRGGPDPGRGGPDPGRGGPDPGRGGRRAALAVLACALLPVAPWALRNVRWFGRPIVFDDRAATPLAYLASAGAVRCAPDRAFSVERTALLDEQQGELSSAKDIEELYDRMGELTRRNLLRHPLVYLRAWAVRCAVVVSTLTRLLRWPCAAALVLGLGLLRGPPWGALYALLAYFAGLYTLVAFQDRYLLPAVPLALGLAGAAVVEAAARLASLRLEPERGRLERAAAGAAAAAAGLACLAAFWRLGGEVGAPRARVAREWADRGWAALRDGRPDVAFAGFDRAAAAAPGWPEVFLGRAVARARLEDARAGADVNEAIRLAWRPWESPIDDANAAWAAAAYEARSGRLERRGRRRAAAEDERRAAALRARLAARAD